MKIFTPDLWQAAEGGFSALWTDASLAYALFDGQLIATELRDGAYPALSPRPPGSGWFERLTKDLNGHVALGVTHPATAVAQSRGPDGGGGTWPPDGGGGWPEFALPAVAGAHQIALGPVHGGIVEPGHFRFSVIGETILKLETRLGYSHKGTLALIRGKSPRLAARFAARVSGDATVAHSLAFAHAAESALGLAPPARSVVLRGVMAEIERMANHAGDIARLAGAAGLAILDARFGWHREALCTAAAGAFGHRLMMDMVIPGGIAADIRTGGDIAIGRALDKLETELPRLRRMFENHNGLQNRLAGIGYISPEIAGAYAAGGFVGRASGRRVDARRHPGYAPYHEIDLDPPVDAAGDAAARIRIRLAELADSIRLTRQFLRALPEGRIAVAPPAGTGAGLGVAESFRGPCWHWLKLDSGQITDVFIADPSTLHWPLLEHAATTGTVADFPLVSHSINASHAGVDL